MSINTITDAFRVKPQLERQLATNCLWIIATMDIDSGELVSLDYQNAFAECLRTAPSRPAQKGRIERFIGRFDRELLMKTQATSLAEFYTAADKYIDTLRDDEGRVFL